MRIETVMKSLFLILLVVIPWVLTAQKYVLSVTEVNINGTSNLHDWTMNSKAAEGEVLLAMDNGKLSNIERLHFRTKVKTLKSGKNTMDNICYEALKEEEHPLITFKLMEVESITNGNGSYIVKVSGWMNIAGMTRKEIIVATGSFKNGVIEFSGKHKLKMSDYDIDAPTALFGTIKTGDEIEVVFLTRFLRPGV